MYSELKKTKKYQLFENHQSGTFNSTKEKREGTEDTELDVDGVFVWCLIQVQSLILLKTSTTHILVAHKW